MSTSVFQNRGSLLTGKDQAKCATNYVRCTPLFRASAHLQPASVYEAMVAPARALTEELTVDTLRFRLSGDLCQQPLPYSEKLK